LVLSQKSRSREIALQEASEAASRTSAAVQRRKQMKTYFLVEADTDYASLFAEQLEKVWADGEFHYRQI